VWAQQAAFVPVKEKKAFVIGFEAPYSTIVVDMDTEAEEFIDTDNMSWTITPATKFINHKKKPLDPAVIRRGMELEISGEARQEGKIATTVKLLTDPTKWTDEVNGYLETVEGNVAWIDGRRVKLASGAAIKGPDGKKYTAFNEMPSGLHLDLSGRVLNDGVLEATSGKGELNKYGATDAVMFRLARASGALPKIENLAGGKAVVAGREVKFSNSFELQAYVNKVGNRLVPQYTRDLPDDFAGKLTWRFAVIEDESFNAFALPDGQVYVHTGLLKQIKNEAQLAAVLGHEIAHATHEHGRKKYEKDQWTSFLGSMLAPFAQGVAGDLGNLAVGLTMLGIRSEYSRDREDQSDRVGVHYMTQAGYDPREAPRVWTEVAKQNKIAESKLKAAAAANGTQSSLNLTALPLFSSHPGARKRVKNLNRVIAQSYHDVDYRKLKVGEKEYMDVVGVYFGWRARPVSMAPPPGASSLAGKGNAKAVSTNPRSPAKAIRRVDFRNFTFPNVDGSYTNLWGSMKAGGTTMRFRAGKRRGADGAQSSVGKIIYSDFDGDGVEEAVILIGTSRPAAGAYWTADCYVYRMIAGQAQLVFHDGRYKSYSINVNGNTIEMTAPFWRDGDGHCCPFAQEDAVYTWSGGTLIRTDQKFKPI